MLREKKSIQPADDDDDDDNDDDGDGSGNDDDDDDDDCSRDHSSYDDGEDGDDTDYGFGTGDDFADDVEMTIIMTMMTHDNDGNICEQTRKYLEVYCFKFFTIKNNSTQMPSQCHHYTQIQFRKALHSLGTDKIIK